GAAGGGATSWILGHFQLMPVNACQSAWSVPETSSRRRSRLANRVAKNGAGQRQTGRADHHQTEREDKPLIDDRADSAPFRRRDRGSLCEVGARHLGQFSIDVTPR